jgi:hypothetical protein
MIRSLMLTAATLLAFAASDAQAIEYAGICEASAGAFIDDTHFVVASDETNKLQIYQRGKSEPIGPGIDMKDFTSFDKSDLEGAARLGDRVYWISSHSFTKKGKDSSKRKVFFATKILSVGGKPTLTGTGRAAVSLRDPLAKAAGVEPREMDIEGLTTTPEGGLLIGLRAPLRNGQALVIPFKNPAAVVDQGVAPEFGEAMPVKLGGLGIRSLDLVGSGDAQYVIIGGRVADSADGFAVFRWSGSGDPVKVEGLNLGGLKPEGAMAVPGQQGLMQLLSDDGDLCSDEEDPPNARKFRSIDVKLF